MAEETKDEEEIIVGSLRSVKVAHHFAKVGVEGSIPRGGSTIRID